VPAKYSHIGFTPPKAAQRAGERALEVRGEKPASQRGMTPVGLARARDLANGKTLSPDTVRRMKAYFDRHAGDKKGSTWSEQGKGWQAWMGWGGDAGYAWARKVVRQMEAADARVSKCFSKVATKVYRTKEEAEARAKELGCSGHHTHVVNGVTYYMACSTMAELTSKNLVGSVHTFIRKASSSPGAHGWSSDHLAYDWWVENSLPWSALVELVGSEFGWANEPTGDWQGYWKAYWTRKAQLGAELPSDLPGWARPSEDCLTEEDARNWQLRWCETADSLVSYWKSMGSPCSGTLASTLLAHGVHPPTADHLISAIEKSTQEKNRAAQKARSSKFGIAVLPQGHVTKPGKWAYLSDSQFGDPVNYRYPLHDKPHIRNARARFAQEGGKAYKGKDVIQQRIAAAAKKTEVGKSDSAPVEKAWVEIAKAEEADDRQIVTGPVLIPNKVDGQGDVMGEEAIEQTAYDFLASYNEGTRLGVQHQMFPPTLKLLESWVLKADWTIADRTFAQGTWFLTTKVLDKELWKKIRSGEVTGYSIGGLGSGRAINPEDRS